MTLERVFRYGEYLLAARSTLSAGRPAATCCCEIHWLSSPTRRELSEGGVRCFGASDALAAQASLRGARCACRATHLVCAAQAAKTRRRRTARQTHVYASGRATRRRPRRLRLLRRAGAHQYEAYESISIKQRAACDDIPTAASKFLARARLVDRRSGSGTAEPWCIRRPTPTTVALKRVAVSNRVGLAVGGAGPAPGFALDLAAHEGPGGEGAVGLLAQDLLDARVVGPSSRQLRLHRIWESKLISSFVTCDSRTLQHASQRSLSAVKPSRTPRRRARSGPISLGKCVPEYIIMVFPRSRFRHRIGRAPTSLR